MRDLMKNAVQKTSDTEHNIRPTRKAATKSCQNPVIEDSASEDLDDSFDDAHYQCPGEEPSSSAESALSDNNNDVAPEKPTKSSRE